MSLQAVQRYNRMVSRRSGQGFTLLELMIVVVIIAILSIIAINSYDKSVMKSRRKAAEGCLQQGAQYMERYYATNLRYDQNLAGVANPYVPSSVCTTDVTNYYNVTQVGAALAATTYTIQAAPKGVQAQRDTQCGTLTLNQTGTQTKSGTGTVADCWE